MVDHPETNMWVFVWPNQTRSSHDNVLLTILDDEASLKNRVPLLPHGMDAPTQT